MTSTAHREILDDVSGVLDALRGAQARIDAAEVDRLRAVVAWATMHSADSIAGPIAEWTEQPVVIAGEGAPEVAEFCVPELAVALGMTHDSAARMLGDAVELAYRLPTVYARVLDGDLRVWKARRIADTTRVLSPAAVAFVDQHVAPTSPLIGVAALDRLVGEAITRFDPQLAEERRLAAAEHRCLDIDLRPSGGPTDGTVNVYGCLDYADARDLDTALTHGAADPAARGSSESLDVRRSQAAGVLARRQLRLDLNADATPTKTKTRQVVLHVHLSDLALARVEQAGCFTVEQVRSWCGQSDTQVVIKPVIDLNATPKTDAYAIPDAVREQVILRDPTCVFPQCARSSRLCDLDHLIAWLTGGRAGPTTPSNLAPLCRRHHRLKTHGGWTYHRTDTGDYEWTSPHGQRAVQRRTWSPHTPPPEGARGGCGCPH